MGIDLRAKILYIPKTGNITSILLPTRVEEFSGTSSDLLAPSLGQHFFQLSEDSNPENASYGLEEGIPWRERGTKYNGFVSFSNSNKYKIFENANDVTITIYGTNITGFAIYFDSVAQQWATELSVNGATYVNEGSIFAWQGNEVSSVVIVIKKWNRANVPARITSISVGLEIEYTKDDFTFVERGMQTIEDNTILSWGVLGQYGKLNIIDVDKEIKDLAAMGILNSGTRTPITIILDGTQIASLIGNRWSYEFDNNVASVELVSNIDKLSNTIYRGYVPLHDKTNIDVFNDLKQITEQVGIIVKLFAFSTENYIKSINQEVLTLEPSNLLDAWTKFCNATTTRFYFNEYMELVLIEVV